MSLIDRRGREVFVFLSDKCKRILQAIPPEILSSSYLPTIEADIPSVGPTFGLSFKRKRKLLIIEPLFTPPRLRATTNGQRTCMAGGLSAALVKDAADLGNGCYRANSMDKE